MTVLDNRELALKAVREGAQDYLMKGDLDVNLPARSLQYAVERHRTLIHLKRLSFIDDLTGLLNRRGFLSLANQHMKIAQRANRELLLFYADLDELKQINDQFGYHEGDQALLRFQQSFDQLFGPPILSHDWWRRVHCSRGGCPQGQRPNNDREFTRGNPQTQPAKSQLPTVIKCGDDPI